MTILDKHKDVILEKGHHKNLPSKTAKMSWAVCRGFDHLTSMHMFMMEYACHSGLIKGQVDALAYYFPIYKPH